MKKVSKVILTIFSVGVLATLIAGAVAFVGYVAALIIGGEDAAVLCTFIKGPFFNWVIRICSITTAFGLIGMYLNKVKALSVDSTAKKDEPKEEEKA